MKDNQAKYPQLRFKGFTDPWEQRKLGEIAIRVRGNDGRMNLPTLTISAGNGWMDQRDRFSQNIAGKEQKNYTLLRQGELSYNHGNSKLAQFGAVFELESYNEALVPRVYHSFSVTAGAQPKFIEQMFATHRPDRELRKLVSSGARMDGLLNINYDDFMGIKVWLPSVAEQQAIAGLLVKLDNTIALHQRKLAKLKELKQGYLQKLFPRNGSKFPQLRFAGFADAWEERKLTDVTSSYSGLTYSPTDVQDKGTFVLRSSNVKNDQLVDADNVYVNPDIVNSNNVKVGDVIVVVRNGSRSLIGKHAIIIKEMPNTVIGAFMSAFRGQNGHYINALLSTNNFQKEVHKSLGATINQITGKDFSMMNFLTPKLEEQSKIGSFFKQLDDTIALHQRKLEKLQELKKGYLQKMFC